MKENEFFFQNINVFFYLPRFCVIFLESIFSNSRHLTGSE